MIPRLATLALALALAACGNDEHIPPVTPVDAGTDAPPDPFEGMFDEGSEFPRTGCRAGALIGFARTNVWVPIGLRTEAPGGALRTFVDDFLGERQVPHLLTADDLIIRQSRFFPSSNMWRLSALDVCDVTADGTVRGSIVYCSEGQGCQPPYPFQVAPTHRITGENEGQNITKLGELALDGHPLNVRVSGDVAYLAMGDVGLRVVSIANPAAPVVVGSYIPAAGNYFNDVKVLEAGGRRYALLAGFPSEVIDVTVPATPAPVATIAAPAHTLFVEGTMVYLVTGGNPRLYIYDLADPRAPVQRAAFDVAALDFFGFHDLFVSGGFVYLSTYSFGLAVVDARTPTAPVLAGMTEEDPRSRYWHSPWLTQVGARPIIVHGDEFPGPESGVRLLDGDPASSTYLDTLGEWHLRDDISTHNVMARGATVYLSHYQDGIRVLDITNPAMPTQIGYFNTWSEDIATAATFSGAIGLDLDVARRRIYVADLIRGFLVLEGTPAVFPP